MRALDDSRAVTHNERATTRAQFISHDTAYAVYHCTFPADHVPHTTQCHSVHTHTGMTSNVVYCLRSADATRSYIGVTNDLPHRLRQHRREITGGAGATHHSVVPAEWAVGCYVQGFATRRHALQFEWRSQRGGLKRRRKFPATRVAYATRVVHMQRTLALERVTSTAPTRVECPLTLIHV